MDKVVDNGAKRADYIKWEEYFMGPAKLAAERSKDPSSQVGVCIVDSNKRIVSLGYNGRPNGISDDDKDMSWSRGDGTNMQDLKTKYPFVVHGEPNAILNAHGNNLVGAELYVTLFPCHECAKLVIQSGIKKVIYGDDKYDGTDSNIAAKMLFNKAGVSYELYKPTGREIKLSV